MPAKVKDNVLKELNRSLVEAKRDKDRIEARIVSLEARIEEAKKPKPKSSVADKTKNLANIIKEYFEPVSGKSTSASPICVPCGEIASAVNVLKRWRGTPPTPQAYGAACTYAFGESFAMKKEGRTVRGYRVRRIKK